MGLAIGVLVTLLLFIRAYQKLNASILNERVEAVQQLGFLLSRQGGHAKGRLRG